VLRITICRVTDLCENSVRNTGGKKPVTEDIMTNKKSDKKSDREIIILMVISLALGLVQVILGLIQVLK